MKFLKLKKGLMIAGLCALTLSTVACGNKEVNVDLVSVKETINTPELMKDLSVLEASPKEHYIFEEVKDSIEDGFMIQAMMNVKLNDVFVIKTSNPELIKKTIEDYKTNNLRSFADGYGGEDNATAMATSKLEQVGNYVYFIATPNNDEIEKKILELIK